MYGRSVQKKATTLDNHMQANKTLDRSEIFERLDDAYRLTQEFDYLCPRECDSCERNDGLVLLPYEHLFIRKRAKSVGITYLPCFKYRKIPLNSGGFLSVGYEFPLTICRAFNADNADEKVCLMHKIRPFDCRCFPIIPFFDVDNRDIQFYLSRDCPVSNRLPPEFVHTRKKYRDFLYALSSQAMAILL